MNNSARNKAVFFDRDGVIVKPIDGDAPRKVKDMELIKEIIPVLKKISSLGFFNIIVSNQPDIALGKIDEKTKTDLEKKFVDLLKKYNLHIDEINYCFHHEKSINPKYPKTCFCRKPKPGMIKMAAKKFKIDLINSYVVGDRASDIKMGKLAGTKTILFDKDDNQKDYLIEHNVTPDYTVRSLKEIEKICKQ